MSKQETPEMVERVARAIKAKVPEGYGMTIAEAREYAVAAIEELMVPTPQMLRACWRVNHPWGKNAPAPEDRQASFDGMKAKVTANWQAMLSEALSHPLHGA